jgi:preprotein translocase subunit SecG
MGILRILLIVVEVATSLLLIGVILLQKTKSEGLGLAFGSGMGETLFGSRAGNVLTKITVTLALVFLANTTILGVIFTNAHETSIMDQRLSTMPVAAPVAQPSAPAPMTAPQTAPTLMTAETPVEAPVAPAADVPVEQPQP